MAKNQWIIFSLAVLLLVLLHPPLFPEDQANPAPGFKYLENYSPHKENDFQPQNWAVLKDKRGIIYIANQGGVLEYDGVSWRLIEVPNRSVRSLAVDGRGIIYVGGENEIGYLAPDTQGTLCYVSLIHHLTHDKKNFTSVWYTYTHPDGIYFMTSKYLFRWNPASQHIKTWEPSYFFTSAFLCSGTLYVQQKKVGLMQMRKDTLHLVAGGETFADRSVEMLVPYDSRTLLIGTRTKGFFLNDGTACKPFPTQADAYLAEKTLYHGIRLSSVTGEFAAATLGGGLVLFDAHGRIKQLFDKASGLQDDSVMYVFEEGGNLWLALSKGISRIEYASPISVYDDRIGLPGIALTVCMTEPKDRGLLYAGTTGGLFYLDSSQKFRPVPGMPGITCWSLLPDRGGLLAAATKGVFWVEIRENTGKAEPKPARQVIDIPSYVLYRSPSEPNRTWVGTAYGLVSLYLNPQNQNPQGQWSRESPFENITDPVKTIVEDEKGNLWLGTLNRGIIKVDFPTPQITQYVLTRYDTAHGLPIGGVNVSTAAGHVIFTTEKGLYRYDETKNRFIPDITLGKTYAAEGEPVFRIAEDKNRDIWFHSRCRNYRALLKPGGEYEIETQPYLRIPLAQVNAIYPAPDGKSVWLAGVDGLVRCDSTVKKNYAAGYSSCIRKVIIGGKRLEFDGYPGVTPAAPELQYRDRNLQFCYAAPFFEAETATRYQVFLEGYDKDWSGWGPETRKDYTNLDPGDYTFRVRAQNIYKHIGREDRYTFKILPPWYREWWAYMLYIMLLLVGGYGVVRWRSWKLRQEKQRLEQVIKDRTKEIEEKNLQLEKQTVQLKKQSLQLEEMSQVKSRFFANLSHEFRTPLTLIMGPLEQLLARRGGKDQELEKEINLALRNSRRLLGLINQLLELSKFDSGKIKLQAVRQDIVPFLKGVLYSFDSLARQQEIDLKFQTGAESITVCYDPEKLEEVIANLLSNAVKFTPRQGKITLAVHIEAAPPGTNGTDQPGWVLISVTDTGPGIPAEQMEHIFDRFYQAESTREHHRKGTGIGLAIAKEIVELHHGTIAAASPGGEGRGAEFVVRLPRGEAHLQPGPAARGTQEGPSSFLNRLPTPRGRVAEGIISIEDVEEPEPGKEEKIAGEPGTQEKDIILVVEDNAEVREYIRRALEPTYTVTGAKDGEEGIQKAREIVPDLIICDVMMPGIDGFETCRQIKSEKATSHIPVVLLTAKAGEEDIIRGLETGADDYITKPFSTRIMSARVKNLIELRRHLQMTINREMTLQPVQMPVSKIDREFLKELQEVIEKNLSDSDFNVEQLGKKLYMSGATLYRKIRALSGESPTDFIRSYRLKRAAQLLKSGYGSVTEVAFEVGFSSRAYFTKCFREKFHQLPSTYFSNINIATKTPRH